MQILKAITSVFYFVVLFDLTNSKSVNNLVAKAVKEVKPHHLVVWTNLFADVYGGSAYSTGYRTTLNNLLNTTPSTLVNIKDLPKFVKPSLGGNYFYNVNVSAPMHIVFLAQDDKNAYIQELQFVFFHIINSIMYTSTPKCLIVFYQSNNSTNPIENICKLSRTLRIGDLAVLQVFRDTLPLTLHYNYVKSKFDTQNGSISVIFPDEMKNINSFNLRVGVYYAWPQVYKENHGRPMQTNRYLRLYKLHECFSYSLNITSTFVLIKGNEDFKTIQSLDLLLIPITLLSYNRLYLTYILDYSKLTALVPRTHEIEIKASMNSVYSIGLIVGFIIAILLLFKCSRERSSGWDFLNIFNLMLGIAANVQLNNIKSKIVYSYLLMISIFCITDFVADLTTVNLVSNEKLLASSIDEILQKNITVCSPHEKTLFLNYFVPESTKEIRHLIENINVKCTSNEKKNSIKILTEEYAEAEKHDKLVQNSFDDFTIIDMNLPIYAIVMQFAPNSPIRDKFIGVDSRIREFGLDIK